jgi:Protein of unknown function (DUF2000)
MPIGVQFNAFGHTALGLAHLLPAEHQEIRHFVDKEGRFVAAMTDHPLIALAAKNSGHLVAGHRAALEAGLTCNSFVIDMKDNTPEFQEAAIAGQDYDSLEFVALGLCGDSDQLRSITKRFSLYR